MVKRYQTPLAIFLFLRVGFCLNARGLKVLFVQGYFCKAAGNEKNAYCCNFYRMQIRLTDERQIKKIILKMISI